MHQSATLALSLPDEAATLALGQRFARALRPSWAQPLVIYLIGPLGAGKTSLVRGLLRALDIRGPIRSPTFTLLEIYQAGPRTLAHLDLYRLAKPEELESLGVRELLEPNHLLLVEWPELGIGALPKADLQIDFEYDHHARKVHLQPLSEAGRVLVNHAAYPSDPAVISRC
jgi:tRNA threonylcarbamoyladenosine biosynthesis protein TsaE